MSDELTDTELKIVDKNLEGGRRAIGKIIYCMNGGPKQLMLIKMPHRGLLNRFVNWFKGA